MSKGEVTAFTMLFIIPAIISFFLSITRKKDGPDEVLPFIGGYYVGLVVMFISCWNKWIEF
jgi:hypothetical protein